MFTILTAFALYLLIGVILTCGWAEQIESGSVRLFGRTYEGRRVGLAMAVLLWPGWLGQFS